MKKLTLLLLLALTVAFATSCKKDYTCTCSYTTSTGGGYYGGGTSNTVTLSSTTIKDTKSNATNVCTALQTTFPAYPTGVSCTIQ